MAIIEPEILVGLGTIVGTGIGSYAAVRKLPFFKKNGNGKAKTICEVPDCHDMVIKTAGRVESLEHGQLEIFKKLDDMPGRIVTLLKDTKGLLGK